MIRAKNKAPQLGTRSSVSFTLSPGYPGLWFLDWRSKRLHTLRVTHSAQAQSTTDCVWRTKWAEDCTTASHCVCQQQVALAGELSFSHSKWYKWCVCDRGRGSVPQLQKHNRAWWCCSENTTWDYCIQMTSMGDAAFLFFFFTCWNLKTFKETCLFSV